MSAIESPEAVTPAGQSRFSPEFQVLLDACAVGWYEANSAWVQSVDWERALRLAEHHGVLPALYERWCGKGRGGGAEVPDAICSELTRRFELNARKNLRLTAELFRVLDCLEGAGIVALPFKGPLLAEQLFGDLALRDFSDLDVLLRMEDVIRAKTALAGIGYVPNSALTPAEERAFLASGYEYTFDGPAGKNLLELQWNFVPRFYSVDFDMKEIFARAVPASVAGRAVRGLANEDLLIALCIHAAKHLWGRLCWLRDIAAAAAIREMQWERVFSEAQRLGVARIVVVSLALSRWLLHLQLPEAIEMRVVTSSHAGKLASQIAQAMPASEGFSSESVAYFRQVLRLRERLEDRARFVTRFAFTPSLGDWRSIHLPEALFPLYRGIRLIRLSGRLLGLLSS